MRPLDGIHHITLITGDARANVDFYVRVLGLRLVKKTVNQDDPGVYHLYYADELGSPGADITFFEYPGAQRGQAGAGMIETIIHRVASEEALDYWQERLEAEHVGVSRQPGRVVFADPEGMQHELGVFDRPDEPLIARSSDVPAEFALQGFEGVRALVADPARSEALLREVLGFQEVSPHEWEARGEHRGGRIEFAASAQRGSPGAGTVHHIAWSAYRADLEDWRARLIAAGRHPTQVIDRFYFESVYFREPGGILYELATYDGAGFAVDEPLETMGEALALPPAYEPLRERIEPALTPVPDVRQWRPAPTSACPYVVGEDGLAAWSDTHAEAWIGLLETHKELTRELDAELEAQHGLSLSGLELLGRLAAAPERHLRLSALAQQSGLSLSRVSRIVDLLEARSLVSRRTCPNDARAVEAHLTDAGLQLAREAQATHFASVHRRFFARLEPGELEVLAAVFGRLSPRAAAACSAQASAQPA
jgi:glyoxalase family protein